MLSLFDYTNIALPVLFIAGAGLYYSRRKCSDLEYLSGSVITLTDGLPELNFPAHARDKSV